MEEYDSIKRTAEIVKSVVKDFETIEYLAKNGVHLNNDLDMKIVWNHSYAILLSDIAASLSHIADELHKLNKL